MPMLRTFIVFVIRQRVAFSFLHLIRKEFDLHQAVRVISSNRNFGKQAVEANKEKLRSQQNSHKMETHQLHSTNQELESLLDSLSALVPFSKAISGRLQQQRNSEDSSSCGDKRPTLNWRQTVANIQKALEKGQLLEVRLSRL